MSLCHRYMYDQAQTDIHDSHSPAITNYIVLIRGKMVPHSLTLSLTTEPIPLGDTVQSRAETVGVILVVAPLTEQDVGMIIVQSANETAGAMGCVEVINPGAGGGRGRGSRAAAPAKSTSASPTSSSSCCCCCSSSSTRGRCQRPGVGGGADEAGCGRPPRRREAGGGVAG